MPAPITKMHQKFAGMNRWLILEQVLSGKSERSSGPRTPSEARGHTVWSSAP